MKKIIAVLLTSVLVATTLFSLNTNAMTTEEIYSYENFNGEIVYYYKDTNGDAYVIENDEKVYIAVPVSIEVITDEDELNELRNSSQNVNLNTITTRANPIYSEVIQLKSNNNITPKITLANADYFYMKCSDLSPFGAKRGFSYYLSYSPDGNTWMKALYVNNSLLFYTRHRRADLGNCQFIKVQIWSYYGTVSSCLLSIK